MSLCRSILIFTCNPAIMKSKEIRAAGRPKKKPISQPPKTSGKPRVRTFSTKGVCEECGCKFEAKTSVTRFCSHRCYQRSYYHKKKGKRKKEKSITVTAPLSSELLTVKQFAQKLGVCKQTVYNMVASGQIRILRFTQRLSFISWPDFIAANRTPLHSQPTDSLTQSQREE